MLDLYKPFTEAGSTTNYFLQLRNFISQLQLFRTIDSSDIILNEHDVTFKLDRFGMTGAYIKINEYHYNYYREDLQITTNMEAYLGDCAETLYQNCKIFTLQTGSSSGFWFYTPNANASVKVILTPVVNVMNPLNTRTVLLIGIQNANPTLYMHYNGYQRISIPTNIKYGQSSDTDNFVLDPLVSDTYKFSDVFVLSGGNTSEQYREVMRFASNQYIQLAGNIYIRDPLTQS